jgi:hypothetical protein
MVFARLFLIIGLVFLGVGGVIYLFARLPGDIRIQTENLTCVIPLVTSILLSIVLTLVLNLVIRFLNK